MDGLFANDYDNNSQLVNALANDLQKELNRMTQHAIRNV